jgi:hypothetical protein
MKDIVKHLFIHPVYLRTKKYVVGIKYETEK